MGLLKKIAFALFMSSAMVVTAPVAMAAGKQANQTKEELVVALDDTVTVAEDALKGIVADTDYKAMMKLFKITKQTAKTIESTVVLSDRDRALARVNKARSAYKKSHKAAAKGNDAEAEAYMTEAVAFMTEAVQRLKDVRTKYHTF